MRKIFRWDNPNHGQYIYGTLWDSMGFFSLMGGMSEESQSSHRVPSVLRVLSVEKPFPFSCKPGFSRKRTNLVFRLEQSIARNTNGFSVRD